MIGMAEMEVSPQIEMANPQDMKVFAVKRHWLPEDFMYFRALWGVQSSPIVVVPNRPIVWGLLLRTVAATGRDSCVSGPELSPQVRRPNSCTSCIPPHMDTSTTCTGRND